MTSTGEHRVLWFATTVVMVYLLFPVLVVVTVSFSASTFLTFPPPGLSLQWYREFFGTPDWVQSLWVSLQVGALTAVLSTAAGIPAAFALARYHVPFRAGFEALMMAALVVPPIIKAISLYIFFVPIGLANSIIGLAIAHTVTGIPYVVLNLMASLKGYDRDLESAAQAHGASPLRSIFDITLPILSPSIAVGAIFAFLQSIQELLVSLFLLGTVEKPLAVRLWEGVRISLKPTIAAASTTLVVLALAAFVLTWLVTRRQASAVKP